MPTSPTVFISYRRKSSVDLAQALHGRLKAEQVDVFFDLDAIGGGEDYELRLQAELDQRDCLLVILAPETLEQSAWVRREIAAALRRHKKIIPVTTGGYTFTRETLPPEIADLARYNYIVYEPRYANPAFDEIKRALGITDNLTASDVGTAFLPSAATRPKPPARTGLNDTTKGVIITGIFAIIVAVIGIVPNLLPKPTETPTPTPTQAVVSVPTATDSPPTATQSIAIVLSVTPLLSTPTPTDTPSITPLPPTPTSTTPPAPVPTAPTATDVVTSVTVYRSGDTVAVCANEPSNLSQLRIDFPSSNETYILGKLFKSSGSSQVGDCWCIEQQNRSHPTPQRCVNEKTTQVPYQADWSNEPLKISLGSSEPQEFAAQPREGIYQQKFSFVK